MKISGHKVLVYFSVLMVLFLLGFLFRHTILLGVAQLLIKEDTPSKVDAIFVLAGAPEERAPKAAELFHQGYSQTVVATGERVPPLLEVLDTVLTEAQLTGQALLNEGVDSSAIKLIQLGTSTFQESDLILGYSEQNNYKRIMLVSSKFHTSRMQRVFRKKFEAQGINLFIVGAEPQRYEISNWWNSEEALIFVNNEYLKHLYYLWKYR